MRTIGQVRLTLAYAAGHHGDGVCYLRIRGEHDRVVRVPLKVRRLPGLGGREVGYSALLAAAAVLRQRSVRRAIFEVPDQELALDITERRQVAPPLVMPYVTVQCALNAFDDVEVRFGEDPELGARARMEAGLGEAA